MTPQNKKIFLMVITLFMTIFFCCKDNYNEIKKWQEFSKFPEGISINFKMKYTLFNEEVATDSIGISKVSVILSSPISKDFTNQEFPYYEFPKGLHVVFYDDEGLKTDVTADYGIMYKNTKLVDLRGNVVLDREDGKHFESSQLYWDQKNQWIFTEKSYNFTSPEFEISGEGIDFNRKFTFVHSPYKKGNYKIKE